MFKNLNSDYLIGAIWLSQAYRLYTNGWTSTKLGWGAFIITTLAVLYFAGEKLYDRIRKG